MAEPLVLASASPQRRAILAQLGVPFRVEAPSVDELAEGEPRAVVLENARRKAADVRGRRVLGADTEVVLDGEVCGKPPDAAQAERFLRRLSGRDHEVLGGLALREAGAPERSAVAVTRVRFRALAEREIAWYLRGGEWRGRAGGYAIQGRGAALVAEVEGDYLNVVGLPVSALIGLVPDLVAG